MSEEKPPEPTSAPLRPYWKMSERKGCVIALLLLGFAGLIVGVMWAGLDGYERDGIWSLASLIFKIILGVLLHTVLGQILLILVPVIGGVLLACAMRYKPPIAPPPLPRTQSEESSNQEAEPSQPPSVPQKPDKENGCCLVLIALGLVFGLIYLIGFYFVLK